MKFKDKEIKVILSEEATDEYNELNKVVGDELKREVTSSVHQTILRSIDRVRGWLKDNPFAGEQVRKNQIPKQYIEKYEITNLWRMDLSNFWRLIYTIRSTEVEIINFVLNIVDHKMSEIFHPILDWWQKANVRHTENF